MATSGGYHIIGKTHQIGNDYVDIQTNDSINTVLRDKIDHIRWGK